MTKMQIRHKETLETLFEHDVEYNTEAKTLRAAIKQKASLCGADFRGVDVRGVSFDGVRLNYEDFYRTNFDKADLVGAVIDGEVIAKPPIFVAGLAVPSIIADDIYNVMITDKSFRVGHRNLNAGLSYQEILDDAAKRWEMSFCDFWRKWGRMLIVMGETYRGGAG